MKLFTISTLAFAMPSALAGSLPIVPNTDSFQCSPAVPLEMKLAIVDFNSILCRFEPTQAREIVEKFVQEKGYNGQACQGEVECARHRGELAGYVASNPEARLISTIANSPGECPIPCVNLVKYVDDEFGPGEWSALFPIGHSQ
ncbi:hypothetical protein H4R33_005239 [Dimargaris cristalligena]|nr:hypothetical protein H4R33_005239 [Dimargaris cristalligena]